MKHQARRGHHLPQPPRVGPTPYFLVMDLEEWRTLLVTAARYQSAHILVKRSGHSYLKDRAGQIRWVRLDIPRWARRDYLRAIPEDWSMDRDAPYPPKVPPLIGGTLAVKLRALAEESER